MKDDCQIANLKARVAELESVRDDLSRAYAVQGLALEEERDRVAELEAGLTAILPTLNEGAASGMVPFQECKDNYALACKLLGVQPQP